MSNILIKTQKKRTIILKLLSVAKESEILSYKYSYVDQLSAFHQKTETLFFVSRQSYDAFCREMM